MDLETVIGLEIHVQLKTKSKMFCRCDNASEGVPPNTLICPICTGHPGTLPVPNAQAIRWAVMAAQALGCIIPEHAKFDRKHYFYPDLPKGYQISQYDEPIGVHGSLTIDLGGREQTIGITRVHLEEDVGKLFHQGTQTLVDYNRAGTPLLEIVTEPEIRSPLEAKAFLQELRLLMRHLGVSNADMEKGELRCDSNISLRVKGSEEFHPKVEVKNLNSFRSVERALAFEVERQRALWQRGKPPTTQETRGWDEAKAETLLQRRKEGAADYRYFPEPDIPPLHFTPEFLREITAETPELPAVRRQRFITMYGLTPEQAHLFIHDDELAEYFEDVVTETREYAQAELGAENAERLWAKVNERQRITRHIANWLLNRISGEHRSVHGLPVPPADLARLLWMVHQKNLTTPGAAKVYEQMVKTKKGPHLLLKELGLGKLTDEQELSRVIEEVLREHEAVAAEYRRGKTTVLEFLIGQVMKKTKGRADVRAVREIMVKNLHRGS